MSVTLKIVLGTVNFTDYLRVSAAKVSDPGTEVFVEYINTPVTSYTLIIPGLDPDNYLITFRDAPDTSSLGTLVSQAFVNAVTGEFEYERRFYTIGSLPGGVSNTDTVLTDPYLENKNVTGTFKEGFRYFKETSEYVHDDAAGTIDITTSGHVFNDGETFIVEIQYATGLSAPSNIYHLFSETLEVTEAALTLDVDYKGQRIACNCAGAVQVITLPALSGLATGDFYYFEHKRNGAQAQTKIVPSGTDKIYFNGGNWPDPELTEVWLAKGESVYLRKEGAYWEIILHYNGTRVGERMAGTYLSHPNYLPEDGRLIDGDEYPALYWWVKNVLPGTHKVTDDTVVSGGYTHPAAKKGQFVIHSTLKKLRLPNTQEMHDRGLKDFDTYGADVSRDYDYPGGYQGDGVKAHGHRVRSGSGGSSTNPLNSPVSGFSGMDGNGSFVGDANVTSNWVEQSGGTENLVKNIGVIYLRRI
jgi:hypothetical protein